MTGSGSVISIENGVTLAIYDEAENEGKITGGSVTTGGGAVTVNGGSFVLNGGVITGNKTTGNSMGASAGAIYLKNSASFLMTGGEIKNNTSKAWGSAIWAGRTTSAKLIIRGDAKILYCEPEYKARMKAMVS